MRAVPAQPVITEPAAAKVGGTSRGEGGVTACPSGYDGAVWCELCHQSCRLLLCRPDGTATHYIPLLQTGQTGSVGRVTQS
jgi:hypothetical protein